MTEARQRALQTAEGLRPTANNISRVAAETSPEDARWAFQQWELRKRARAKFLKADQMLFDGDGLEMATHERIAEYHGGRFSGPVVDLTTGIGSDLIGLARFNKARGFELDPLRAEYARHNLSISAFSAIVEVADGLAASWKEDYAFCDPSRRVGERRTLRLGEFSPDPRAVADRFGSLKLGCIKLSPMLSDQELESFGGSLEFVSFGGECREGLVWLGREIVPGSRFAVHVETGARIEATGDPPVRATPARFLYEADPAAIRAHCLAGLCAEHRLWALGNSNGYLTGDEEASSVWLKSYEVLAWHRADIKRTTSELRRFGGGTPIVKSRAKVDVEALRRQLKGEGEELILIVYADGPSLKHAICRSF